MGRKEREQMLDLHARILASLDEQGIDYQIIKHPAAKTTEEADEYIKGHEGLRSKTLLLTNKRKNKFYMVILDDNKRLDMQAFAEIVEQSRVKMVSAELLAEKFGLVAGVISPLALLDDFDNEVEIYFDQEVMDEKIMTFHPNTNEETLFIETTDLIKFLKNINHVIHYVDL